MGIFCIQGSLVDIYRLSRYDMKIEDLIEIEELEKFKQEWIEKNKDPKFKIPKTFVERVYDKLRKT